MKTRWIIVLVTAILMLPMIGFLSIYLYFTASLPKVDNPEEVKLDVPLRIYGADGKLKAEYSK